MNHDIFEAIFAKLLLWCEDTRMPSSPLGIGALQLTTSDVSQS